eukprot:2028457-Pyramimonas_sp.AAC.1
MKGLAAVASHPAPGKPALVAAPSRPGLGAGGGNWRAPDVPALFLFKALRAPGRHWGARIFRR